MSEIKVVCEYTADDYVRSTKYLRNRKWWVKYFLAFPLILMGIMIFSVYVSNQAKFAAKPQNIILLFLPFVVIGGVMLLRLKGGDFFMKRQFEKQIRSSPTLQEAKTMIFTENGVNGYQSLATGEASWDAFVSAEESEKDFYLFTSNKAASFIPKRGFQSKDDENELRELIREKLGDKAKNLAINA